MNRLKLNKIAIEDLKGESNYAFGLLYEKYFPKTRKFILNNRGSLEDAEDVFQDALLVVYEKLYSENFHTYTCIGNYILGVAKNLWLKKLNNRHYFVEFPEKYYQDNMEEINRAIENERDYWNKLEDYMMVISVHCQNLIHDIFYKNRDIGEIQEKYHYSTLHNAQNQKHKCLEQIRKVKEKAETEESRK